MDLPGIGWLDEGGYPVRDTLDLIGELGISSRFAASAAGWKWPMSRTELYLQSLLVTVNRALGAKVNPDWPWSGSAGQATITDADRERGNRIIREKSAYKGPWPDEPTWEQPTFGQPSPDPMGR